MEKWISIDERLPKHDGRYAIVYEQGNVRRRFVGVYLCVEKRWTSMLDAKVTHWCNLPPLPNLNPKNTESIPAQDSESRAVLEGVDYHVNQVDAETISLTRCL